MVLAPVADRRAHRHEARIGLFVIDCFIFAGAAAAQLPGDELGESARHFLFVVAGTKTIAEPERPTDDTFFQGIEMRGDLAFDQSEMRQEKFRWIQCPDFRDRLPPRLDVEFRRNKRRHRWTSA